MYMCMASCKDGPQEVIAFSGTDIKPYEACPSYTPKAIELFSSVTFSE